MVESSGGAQVKNHCVGAVMGAFVGDSIGSFLEFRPVSKCGRHTLTDINKALLMPGGGVHKVAPGQITDDSEMALCMLHALTEQTNKKKPETFHRNFLCKWYGKWARSAPFDIGGTTRNAVFKCSTTNPLY